MSGQIKFEWESPPKVGQRVVALFDFEGAAITGLIGTIRRVNSGNSGFSNVGVEFDKNMGGHNLDGLCEHNYGWNIPRMYVKPIKTIKVYWEDLLEKKA